MTISLAIRYLINSFNKLPLCMKSFKVVLVSKIALLVLNVSFSNFKGKTGINDVLLIKCKPVIDTKVHQQLNTTINYLKKCIISFSMNQIGLHFCLQRGILRNCLPQCCYYFCRIGTFLETHHTSTKFHFSQQLFQVYQLVSFWVTTIFVGILECVYCILLADLIHNLSYACWLLA